MKNIFLNNLVIVFSLASLVACGDKYSSNIKREIIPNYNKIGFSKPQWKEISNPIYAKSINSCNYLKALKSYEITQGQESYSLFKNLKKDLENPNSFLARIDIDSSIFTKFYIGNSFEVPDKEKFYQMAKAEYEAGKLSWAEWKAIQAAYNTGIGYDSIKYSAVNKKLIHSFPGIFGKLGNADQSLYLASIKKASYFNSSNPPVPFKTHSLNKAVTPLFLGDNWKSFSEDSLGSLSVALGSLYEISNFKEKQCANYLLQRNFAQLLSLKGYKSPIYKKKKRSKLEELDPDNHPSFQLESKPGSYIDLTGSPLILSNEDIANYDPAKKFLSLASSSRPGLASAAENIQMLNSMLQFFQATSPAHPKVQGPQNYLLGDITEVNTALLPYEATSLSLGMLLMNFKNIAALNLVKVNATGTELKEGQSAAGVLIGDRLPGSDVISVSLDSVSKLSDSIVYLERSLDLFKREKPEYWKTIHPAFTEVLLIKLLGTEMFTEEQIEDFLPGQNFKHSQSLISYLNPLQLPLAHLMISLRSLCVSGIERNLKTGESNPTGFCTDDLKEKVKQSINLIAKHNDAAILWQED